jgi:hypothetical protein
LSSATRSRFLAFCYALVGLMAQTGALIVERLFKFVSVVRLVFFTLITNDVLQPWPWRAVSQSVPATSSPSTMPHLFSPSVDLCSFS